MASIGDDFVRVALIGAGPWARHAIAPMLARGPETRLTGIWARRNMAARELAAEHRCLAYSDLDELIGASDAVAFAVPPDVQAELAPVAIRAGKPILLQKPVAADVHTAASLTTAVAAAGVPSMIALSWRFAAATRSFLATADQFKALGGRGLFVSGGHARGVFRTPWRLALGPLFDLGPHVFDLLDVTLGPISEITCRGHCGGLVTVVCEHASGTVSSATLCATTKLSRYRAGIEIYSHDGVLELDCARIAFADSEAAMRREFAQLVRERRTVHPLDVSRGLQLQGYVATAASQLAAS